MIEKIGRWFILKLKNFFYATGFLLNILKESFLFLKRRQVGLRVLIMQILFTGIESIGIISLISLSLGAVIIIQGISLLPVMQGKKIERRPIYFESLDAFYNSGTALFN